MEQRSWRIFFLSSGVVRLLQNCVQTTPQEKYNRRSGILLLEPALSGSLNVFLRSDSPREESE